jgi:vacuolar protein sorting-associated protein 54
MSQVFFSFTSQLSEEITRTPVKSEKGKARLRRDVEYFTRKLSSLSHVDPPSSAVLEAVDTLVIPTSPPSSPVPSDTAS